jgi:hypothetical protein
MSLTQSLSLLFDYTFLEHSAELRQMYMDFKCVGNLPFAKVHTQQIRKTNHRLKSDVNNFAKTRSSTHHKFMHILKHGAIQLLAKYQVIRREFTIYICFYYVSQKRRKRMF